VDGFTRNRSLYWDGQLVAADHDPGRPDKAAILSMGASTVFGGRFLDGAIDEVALWNRSLSPNEVAGLFNASAAGRGGAGLPPPGPEGGMDPGFEAPTYDLPPETVGVAVASYPDLVQVPGYPVYYAPNMNSNYFFYDGMYWLYQGDQWYASSWFNGPWGRVRPEAVPVFILRVPVSYYRRTPAYFNGWRRDAPPRWGEHWGPAWEQRQRGWDTWDRHAVVRPAPLPEYQRAYGGTRYPRGEQQHLLHMEQYHYQPTSPVAREHFQRIQNPPSQRPSMPSQQPVPQPQRPSLPPGQAMPQQQTPHPGPLPGNVKARPNEPKPAAPAPEARKEERKEERKKEEKNKAEEHPH
jgi:hypothetical protein